MLKQLPWTFVVVVAGAIFMTIFFGAWAVSADIEGRYGELVVANQQQTLASAADPFSPNSESADGAWWKDGLLFACPFH